MTENTNPASGAIEQEFSLGFLLRMLWKRRIMIVGITFLCGLIAAGASMLMTPIFSAHTSLLPKQQEGRQNILGQLASLTDMSLGGTSAYEDLYGRIIISNHVLDKLMERRWTRGPDDEAISLPEAFGAAEDLVDTPENSTKRSRFRQYLRRRVISFNRRAETGFMTIHTRVPNHPRLASDLANALADELDVFLQETSRSRASDQKRFIENRLMEVEKELDLAATRLAEFESRNVTYHTSPELKRLHDELDREVRVQSTVWIELKQQLEIAKIDERKDTIAVEILDRALPPTEKSAPWRSMISIFGAAMGFVLACLLVLVRDRAAFSALKW